MGRSMSTPGISIQPAKSELRAMRSAYLARWAASSAAGSGVASGSSVGGAVVCVSWGLMASISFFSLYEGSQKISPPTSPAKAAPEMTAAKSALVRCFIY